MQAPDQLMALHLTSVYTTNRAGQLKAVNQWDGGAVPRMHLCRSVTGNRWRFRHDVAGRLAAELDSICRSEPALNEGHPAPRHRGDYERLLAAAGPIERTRCGPVFAACDRLLPLAAADEASIVAITSDNATLLAPAMPDWLPDVPHRSPFLALIANGQAVAVCASVRITRAAHEAGLEVHPDHRGRGYALAVVSAWAEAVQRLNALPLYSTAWDNLASRAVAARLGLTFIGEDYAVY